MISGRQRRANEQGTAGPENRRPRAETGAHAENPPGSNLEPHILYPSLSHTLWMGGVTGLSACGARLARDRPGRAGGAFVAPTDKKRQGASHGKSSDGKSCMVTLRVWV